MRYVLLLTYLAFIFLLSPIDTQAHVLIVNSSVGAVVHISPTDNPIANSPSSFFFEFKDRENKFRPEICLCMVIVYDNSDKKIFSKTLSSDPNQLDLNSSSFTYTFPKKNNYTLKVIGKPLTPNAFTPFILSYDIRVTRINTTSTNTSSNFYSKHQIHLIGGLLIGIFVIGAYIRQIIIERKIKTI